MKTTFFMLFSVIFSCAIVSHGNAYEFRWEIDETPEGQESATVVEPVQVTILDEQVEVSSNSASIWLMKRYSVHLGTEWSPGHAYRLLETFKSIPQYVNHLGDAVPSVPTSVWMLNDQHIQDDISIEYHGEVRVVTVSTDAFVHATPLLAEIEGVRGRYFSKRLHHAVVRFVTDNGADRQAIRKILRERFAVSIDIPDYVELTRYTTGEQAGRFSEFKNKELIAIISMFEEMPTGMHKTQGLEYLVRRLDGTSNPRYPGSPAVAWTSAGYIEFMESAFKGQGLDYVHRLILHEKAHFLWEYLFDEQLKQDWIEIGGWYKDDDAPDGWFTTKQTEFVSAYAHGANPNEDMAESISFYIIRPDKLRSRAPEKYEFIQNRIMHGTRYISQIREDLTFEVYNLYPDYVYPGRIKQIYIKVEGEPEEDKKITAEIEIHSESGLDTAHSAHTRVISDKGTYFDMGFYPVDENGNRITAGHILRSYPVSLSKFAANGYWAAGAIKIRDANKNERYSGFADFGWKLYIDNPLADCEPPEYVPDSMRLSLSKATTSEGEPYQIVTASWEVIEESGIKHVHAALNDNMRETYSIAEYGRYDIETDRVVVKFLFPEYMPSGIYSLNSMSMLDIALNLSIVRFTDSDIDEAPKTIEIKTKTPDIEPPVLDVNRITIKAEPTIPEAPNGETIVDISFWIKDNISGYTIGSVWLRDPQGIMHHSYHYPEGRSLMYFNGDPTVYKNYTQRIVLPVGSVPGTWGLAQMDLMDKARNWNVYDFTEIVQFVVDDTPGSANKTDVNGDGKVNILDLVIVAQAFDTENDTADVNGDGTVNILDLVEVASRIGEEDMAAPAINSPTADQIQGWITQAMQADDGSPAFRRGILALQNLLLSVRPETTALLPNYPNPFNPETWIPYHLANDSDVQITIYDTRGSIIRTFSLGHCAAGYYTDKNRAAYWDGRNDIGERIGSGIYFYQLRADSISQLRKMVILK